MIWWRVAAAGGIALAFLASVLTGLHWRHQRNDLLAAASAASHAAGKDGQPRDLSTGEAVKAIRGLGTAVDQAKIKTAQAQADDATSALDVQTRDAATSTGVSTDVLDQLARTRRDLDAARNLAAQRLRELAAARAAGGGGAVPAVPYDPEPACRAYAGTSCDGLLAELAAAQQQTQQLLGWQRFYPEMKANHDAAAAADALPANGVTP